MKANSTSLLFEKRLIPAAAVIAAILTASSYAAVGETPPARTHAFRKPAKMEMLRPGEVKPQGWLRDWCVTARNGYVSRMDEIDQAFPRAWNRDFHPRGKYLDWGDPTRAPGVPKGARTGSKVSCASRGNSMMRN